MAAPNVDDRDKLERQYMEVVARYQNKDDIRKMPELLAISYDPINAGGIDFLGSVAGELGTLDAKLGQSFTPYEVSRINMRGIDGRVICGNSLSLEVYTSAYSAAALFFINHNGIPFDKIPKGPVINLL